MFRALRPFVERDPDTILICDGGEFAQWGQSMLPVRRRLINGVTGSIGSGLSFALAARLVEPKAPVFAVLGDGTIGFHISEFETAVRRGLPFVAILGNDARWNAESEIQRRDYGANRMHGCELLPSRYDQVVAALGGHGEYRRARRRPSRRDRARARQRQAGLRQRHDREHRRAGHPALAGQHGGGPQAADGDAVPVAQGRPHDIAPAPACRCPSGRKRASIAASITSAARPAPSSHFTAMPNPCSGNAAQ